jgi:hypothetical protein
MTAAGVVHPDVTITPVTHGVPAYFHPAVAPDRWRRLRSQAARLRFVVVNPESGPGGAPDPTYVAAAGTLADVGARTVGYVDTAYGTRSPADVVADAARYREWYGVNGIFLDQCSSGLADLGTFEQYVTALRADGARFLVLNPGTHPHRAYVDLANVTVTFEGPWREYRGLQVPDWVRDRPAERYCHLVYDVPVRQARRPELIVSDLHVGTVCLTDGGGPNPWDRVPPALRGR